MIAPDIPANEKERLLSLESYAILDTLPEENYNNITKLASEICNAPIAAITLVDDSRQWFKSIYGVEIAEVPRTHSFCAHSINQPDELTIVADSDKDVRFVGNPFTEAPYGIKFYAGVPLTNNDGLTLGTLCIMDRKPRLLDKNHASSLKSLGSLVVQLLESRRNHLQLEKSQDSLRAVNKELKQFAYIVTHDIRSPLNNIIALTALLESNYSKSLDSTGAEIIEFLGKATQKLKNFTEGILSYYTGDALKMQDSEIVDISKLLEEIIEMLERGEFEFNYPPSPLLVKINKSNAEQIFINLISNAIKYNDKPKGIIEITFSEDKDFYNFTVSDNGTGIAAEDFEKVFKVFETLNKKDRFQNYGTGIGLSTVKKLVERAGGKLTLTSEVGIGSRFNFTIRK